MNYLTKTNSPTKNSLTTFKAVFCLFLLSFGSALFAQDGLPPYGPCPPYSASTEFCFENSSLYASNCERTICITYNAKEDKRDELANCVKPADGTYCITLGVDEMGCIDIPHPAGEFSDWFNIDISIRMTEDGETFLLDHGNLNHTVENQTPLTWYEYSGCDTHHTIIRTSDGRNFIIGDIYL